MIDVKMISEGVGMVRSVVETIKTILSILPTSDRNEVTLTLQKAEKRLSLSEAKVAKGLGYELCRCTWPPQIMVYAGDAEYGEKFRCPACKRVVSPDDMPQLGE